MKIPKKKLPVMLFMLMFLLVLVVACIVVLTRADLGFSRGGGADFQKVSKTLSTFFFGQPN